MHEILKNVYFRNRRNHTWYIKYKPLPKDAAHFCTFEIENSIYKLYIHKSKIYRVCVFNDIISVSLVSLYYE